MFEFTIMKTTMDYISSQINKGQEPGSELVAITAYIDQLTSEHATLLVRPTDKDQPLSENTLTDDQRKYIMEDMSPSLIKKMMRERSNSDLVSIQ